MARQKKGRHEEKPMLFTRRNYQRMGLGVILVIVGFLAMYLENEVRGFISLYISPVVIVSGYMTVIFAIMKRDKPSEDTQRSV